MNILKLATIVTLVCACFSSFACVSQASRPCVDGGYHQWGKWRLSPGGDRVGVTGLPKQQRRCDICGVTQEAF